MNTIQIEQILENDKYSKKYFKSVLSIDQLQISKSKIKNSAFVINTDKRTGKGEHWISVFYDKNSDCQFFDSLGFGPEFYGLDQFFMKTGNNLTTNKFAVQSVLSEYCGHYSVLFILIRSRKIAFQKFLEYFNEDVLKNDLKLKNFLQKFI